MNRHEPLSRLRLWLPLALLFALALSLPSAATADPPPKDSKSDSDLAAPKNVAELKAIEARVKTAAAKVVPCTVGVQVGRARGSGVSVSEDGYVMTAGHVVGKPGQKVAGLPDRTSAGGSRRTNPPRPGNRHSNRLSADQR